MENLFKIIQNLRPCNGHTNTHTHKHTTALLNCVDFATVEQMHSNVVRAQFHPNRIIGSQLYVDFNFTKIWGHFWQYLKGWISGFHKVRSMGQNKSSASHIQAKWWAWYFDWMFKFLSEFFFEFRYLTLQTICKCNCVEIHHYERSRHKRFSFMSTEIIDNIVLFGKCVFTHPLCALSCIMRMWTVQHSTSLYNVCSMFQHMPSM